ncbi:MAG: arsenate reductase ArsC [Aquificae bacterium]|nr:arsenate reductase ArsC [Aquificota bacterium]
MVKIGFICTGNSARSQMAEGIARKVFREKGIEGQVYSAGSKPAEKVHPLALKVLDEIGVSLQNPQPKHISQIPYDELDIVITLCGEAEKDCPPATGKTVYHWRLKDPAAATGTEEEKIKVFRQVRDRIHKKVLELAQSLKDA